MRLPSRRDFLRGSLALALAPSAAAAPKSRMRFGLVTYLWGRDWDLPTLLSNCEKTRVLGVELRTTHKHGVEPRLSPGERAAVKKRFADTPVTLVGIGSDEKFHHADPARLQRALTAAKAFVRLSRDVGGSGVKVKPDGFPEGVPREKTIEQIGKSLNELGKFADDHGQQIRLEVHGRGTQQLPNIKAILDVADHERVAACWNCNPQDLDGKGLDSNFGLVEKRLGATVHVRELNVGKYPYARLFRLLKGIDYGGWVLLEARTNPPDRVKALAEQRKLWQKLTSPS